MVSRQHFITALLRSILYLLGTATTLILIFFPLSLVMLVLFVPFPIRFRVLSRWGRFNIWWLRVTCGVNYEIEGQEHIPQDRAAIIYVKHESTWETFAMQKFFPPHAWILKRNLLLIPFFGWGLASLSPIAINRGNGHKAVHQIVEQGIRKLNQGEWVMVFPEGTRVPNGTMKKFGIGGAALAEKSGFPIIPVAHNAGAHWPRGSFLKYPGTIHIVIGEPITVEGKTASQISQEAEDWMRTTMEQINGAPIQMLARK